MSTTLCIVCPGRAVRHQDKRHSEGALLHLNDDDVKQLTEMGFVSVASSQAAPATSTTPETVSLAVANFAHALVNGQVPEVAVWTPEASASVSLTPPTVSSDIDNVATASTNGLPSENQAEAPTSTSRTDGAQVDVPASATSTTTLSPAVDDQAKGHGEKQETATAKTVAAKKTSRRR